MEQLELMKCEFKQMHVNEADHANNKGGWTDHEAKNEIAGKNAFCSGGEDCPVKGVPQRRNELFPVWKQRMDDVFGESLLADWQGYFNAYCQTCAVHNVDGIDIRSPSQFLNMCTRNWKTD